MAKRRPLPPKKRRTREHVIADLSVNHVERQALLCGFTVQRMYPDYGYDLFVFTFDDNGEAEKGELRLQLKGTERLQLSKRQTYPFSADMSDIRLWKSELTPVILILYEAENNRAYWIHIQAYLEELAALKIDWTRKTLTIHVPQRDLLSKETFAHFAEIKRKAKTPSIKE